MYNENENNENNEDSLPFGKEAPQHLSTPFDGPVPLSSLDHFLKQFLFELDYETQSAGSSSSSVSGSHDVQYNVGCLAQFLATDVISINQELANPKTRVAVAARSASMDQVNVEQELKKLCSTPYQNFSFATFPGVHEAGFLTSGIPGQSTLPFDFSGPTAIGGDLLLEQPVFSGSPQAGNNRAPAHVPNKRARASVEPDVDPDVITNNHKVRVGINRVFPVGGQHYKDLIAMTNTEFDAGLKEAFQTFRRDHGLLGPTDSLTKEQKAAFKGTRGEGSAIRSERKQSMADEVARSNPHVPVNVQDPRKPLGVMKQNDEYKQLIKMSCPEFNLKLKEWNRVMTRREVDMFKIRRREHNDKERRARKIAAANGVREEEEEEEEDQAE
jgi:hypothetical protein